MHIFLSSDSAILLFQLISFICRVYLKVTLVVPKASIDPIQNKGDKEEYREILPSHVAVKSTGLPKKSINFYF